MNRLLESMEKRRSFYALGNSSPISDAEIEKILRDVVKYVPSAFDSRSTRLVLLLGKDHIHFWDIVKTKLKALVGDKSFVKTEEKINKSFQGGYGTVLFFEEEEVVTSLQKSFPLYSENFPIWSNHTSAMHQYAAWVLLEDAGFGASLQHYNPLIDEEVIAHWKLPATWKLIAQMPFGKPLAQPGAKEFKDLDKQLLVFK